MHKKKEVVQDVTLHDLDAANARPQVPNLASYAPCAHSGNWVHVAAGTCSSEPTCPHAGDALVPRA